MEENKQEIIAGPLADPLFRRIGRIAAEGGQRAYVIGGYVRDWYLGRPCTDIAVTGAK